MTPKKKSSGSITGSKLESNAKEHFDSENIVLKKSFELPLGHRLKKIHKFDLGSKAVLVECKAHRWRKDNQVPSAKMTIWNEAMYFFHLSPRGTRKILFVLKHFSPKRKKTLGEYYISRYSHMIPRGTEILEWDPDTDQTRTLWPQE